MRTLAEDRHGLCCDLRQSLIRANPRACRGLRRMGRIHSIRAQSSGEPSARICAFASTLRVGKIADRQDMQRRTFSHKFRHRLHLTTSRPSYLEDARICVLNTPTIRHHAGQPALLCVEPRTRLRPDESALRRSSARIATRMVPERSLVVGTRELCI